MTATESRAAGNAGERVRITTFTLALNYLPLVQLLTGAAVVLAVGSSARSRFFIAAAWLYLVPPLMCRLTILVFGRPQGRGLTQETRAYKVWWFTHQWQVVFNRLPWLEELLRLVPGLYALWIRLWGGKVSPWAYWGPGSIVADRHLVIVEEGAVIGMGAGLTGHLGHLAADGIYTVDIAAPCVGRGAIMGTRSGLGPSAELAPNQVLRAGRLIPPYVRWDGRAKKALT
ncbi:MAG TPA: hypothetical protein VMZ90_05895 [Vicinamibacterales bacterium]|nr:hypothetical protein [Vicinamibacterales bacterium]